MTYACVSLCSIMIAIVVCIARSELNTHIIKIILSVPKCVPKKPNLHTFSDFGTHFGTLPA
jgi:hypothetical protein